MRGIAVHLSLHIIFVILIKYLCGEIKFMQFKKSWRFYIMTNNKQNPEKVGRRQFWTTQKLVEDSINKLKMKMGWT